MTTYLDVKVAHIQQYLGRTPDLKGRRGASAWLSDATNRDRLDKWLTGLSDPGVAGVEVNTEAGYADGLVPLRMPIDVDPITMARHVIDYLRQRLPAAHLHAQWGAGASYIEAHRAWSAASDPPALVAPPANADFPALQTCGQCRADPGLEQTTIHDQQRWLCADCLRRYDKRYRAPGLRDGSVPVGAELDLINRLGADPDRVAADFADLAKQGRDDGNKNHLATVFIDGNAIGALFGRVAASGDPHAKQAVSKAVSRATRRALHTATAAILNNDDAAVPVIPHVVGGDDLLVSVVADRAWRFVTGYLAAFAEQLGGQPAVTTHQDGHMPPSASAGVVFAHSAFPFGRAVELAGLVLREAKRAHGGRVPAAMWLDVTREGEQPVGHRAAWTLDDLTYYTAALTVLRQVPASGRAVLEDLVDVDDPGLSAGRLRDHARRLERAEVLEPFLDDSGSVARLADALALARWWT